MTYELAKQLKDAGFRVQPSGSRRGYTLTKDGKMMEDWHDYPNESWGSKGEHYFIPTLSELIEACGEGFASLTHFRGNNWAASYATQDEDEFEQEEGKTPHPLIVLLIRNPY